MKHLLYFAAFAAICTACGTTRATISRPAEGTCTTITITTNNPISTNVDPVVSDFLKKGD